MKGVDDKRSNTLRIDQDGATFRTGGLWIKKEDFRSSMDRLSVEISNANLRGSDIAAMWPEIVEIASFIL